MAGIRSLLSGAHSRTPLDDAHTKAFAHVKACCLCKSGSPAFAG